MSENSNKSSGQGHSVAVAGTGASVPAANGSSGQSGQVSEKQLSSWLSNRGSSTGPVIVAGRPPVPNRRLAPPMPV